MDPNAEQDEQKIEVKRAAEPEPVEPQNEQPPADEENEPKDKDKEAKVVPQQGGHKKKRWVWILLALVLLGGLAYWYFVMKDSGSSDNTSNTSTNQSQNTQDTNSYNPVDVAYAFKGEGTPYTLYTRPSSGGERKAAEPKLETSDFISDSDVNGEKVVFATQKAIYVSTDGGKTYKAVIKLSQGEQITSIKLSTDGSSMVYGYLASADGKNVVKTKGLDGVGGKDLFSSESQGVYIISYNSDKQKMLYSEGCYNCDGPAGLPILKDLKANKNTNPISGIKADELVDVNISDDFSVLVFAKATENPEGEAILGTFTAAPYAITTIDFASNKSTQIATFGTKNEKNANGTLRARTVHAGFVAGSKTPYYTDDAKLYTFSGGKSALIYEATKPILYVPFIGNDTRVIVGVGDDTADYKLVNYDMVSKKTTEIFTGDNNTIIFGVTTK